MTVHGDDSDPKSSGSVEDLLLWKAFTKDIDPLGDDPDWAALEMHLKKQNKQAVRPPEIIPKEIVSNPSSKVEKTPYQKGAPQLDRRTEDKLRKGKMAIEAMLDLHGYTQDQAHHSFVNFISKSAAQGKRCVLVITGKGRSKSSQDNGFYDDPQRGILRQRLPDWAQSITDILKIVPAHRKDGGDGAFYIYLKRQK